MSEIIGQGAAPAPALPKGECCATCHYARFEIAAPNLRDCCAEPPKMFMAQSARGPMFITEFPKMKPTQWCGHWKKSAKSFG